MRATVIALGFVAALGGCATAPGGAPTVDTGQVTAIEAQVQQTAAAVCGFVPTISTVASIVATFSSAGPIVEIVNQVAKSICDAVAPAKRMLNRGQRTLAANSGPVVNGVRVQGYFIR